jgi:hypothetical protein
MCNDSEDNDQTNKRKPQGFRLLDATAARNNRPKDDQRMDQTYPSRGFSTSCILVRRQMAIL